MSDYPDGKTIKAYGVDYREGQSGQLFARPSFFLVDKAGIVRGYWGQRPPNPKHEVWAPDPQFSNEPILTKARELAKEK